MSTKHPREEAARVSQRAPIRLQRRPPSLGRLDMSPKARPRRYEAELADLQERLKRVSMVYKDSGLRAIIVLEGWDAAGKGGVIRRLSWPLDPRGLKVWSIGAPAPEDTGRHYLYRFWARLPRPGQLVVFDRSWYGRVLVERVEGFATDDEWRRAYTEINEFECMLTDDGIRLVKIFLHITPDEQLARFRARFEDPLKRWKLTEEDLRNRARFADYETAVDEMFRRTSTVARPWTVIPANDKRHARLAAFRRILEELSRGVDTTPPELDPAFERRVRRLLRAGRG